MSSESIFTTILRRVLWTTLVPLGCIILIISFFVCAYFNDSETSKVEEETRQYVLEAKEQIDEALSVVESIQSYPYIVNNLANYFENAYDVFDFVSYSNTYMDNIMGTLDGVAITIYYTNETLYESKYFVHREDFDRYEQILEKINRQQKTFIWEEGIREGEDGSKQIVFYKKFPLSSCDILECIINLPEINSEIEVFDGTETDSEDEKHIIRNINENIKVRGIINYKALRLRYAITLLTALGCMAGLFVLIYFVALRVLKKTTRNIMKFIEGLDVEDLDELDKISTLQSGVMSKELFTVSKTISMLCKEVKNVEDEKKNIEIELAQRKISYHTVYNALSAIRIKSYENNEPEITQIVDGLVEYYRMVLNKGDNMTFLSDEIAMSKKYVLVSGLSNYEAYHFEAEIPDELKFCRIPHMIILPFVENAINHGLSGMDYEGLVRVVCARDGDYLTIRVYDNGVGISPDKLEKLNNLEHTNLGYGIKNVYARLKLFYGSDSTIRFTDREGGGTLAIIRFRAF